MKKIAAALRVIIFCAVWMGATIAILLEIGG